MPHPGQYHVQLHQAILALDPIAYWLLDEKQGTIIHDWVNPAQNGTASSDVATWPVGAGCGDGRTAPQFDGANDYVNILAANGVFNGVTGSLYLIAKNTDWAPAGNRNLFNIFVNANNSLQANSFAGIANISLVHRAGGVSTPIINQVSTETGFFDLGITWDEPNTTFAGYYQGNLITTKVIGGNWAGVPIVMTIGVYNTTPVMIWHGQICNFVLFDKVLSAGEFAFLHQIWKGQ